MLVCRLVNFFRFSWFFRSFTWGFFCAIYYLSMSFLRSCLYSITYAYVCRGIEATRFAGGIGSKLTRRCHVSGQSVRCGIWYALITASMHYVVREGKLSGNHAVRMRRLAEFEAGFRVAILT